MIVPIIHPEKKAFQVAFKTKNKEGTQEHTGLLKTWSINKKYIF